MEYDSLIARAKALVQQGTETEGESPAAAKQMFVEAAALLLEGSRRAPSLDARKESLDLANQLYLRSQQVQEQKESLLFKNATVSFKDIAGMDAVKEEIRLKLIAPLKYPEVFAKYGKQVGGGILMYGPPGCGKSLLAEATAGEAGVPFFNVKASSLKSKYVGETEKNIANLFAEARKHEAAIVFFDEFEALGADRNKTSFSFEKNFVSQLLTELDGVGSKNQRLLVIAATNLPWEIDLALRRDGRFGTAIFIPPPDASARREMLQMMLKSCPTQGIEYDELMRLTEAQAKIFDDLMNDIADKTGEQLGPIQKWMEGLLAASRYEEPGALEQATELSEFLLTGEWFRMKGEVDPDNIPAWAKALVEAQEDGKGLEADADWTLADLLNAAIEISNSGKEALRNPQTGIWKVLELEDIKGEEAEAFVARSVQQADGFQGPDGLPHRGAADLELLRELPLRGQLIPGAQVPQGDQRLELRHDVLGDAGLLDFLQREGVCHQWSDV